jgi:O-antigen/teichoic acid export membrane protein
VTDLPFVRGLVAVGIRNHLLTLAERAPQLLLPILVTELLSPSDNAAWYVAWMTAWVVFIVPVQVGMTTFAEAARDPSGLEAIVRRGVVTSLAVGVPAAIAAALLAEPLLPLLGDTYATHGTDPLRVLVAAVVPLSFTYGYYSACRATGRLGQATVAAWIVGALGATAAVAAGTADGLTAMAAAWVAVQFAAALWFGWRLRVLVRDVRAAD